MLWAATVACCSKDGELRFAAFVLWLTRPFAMVGRACQPRAHRCSDARRGPLSRSSPELRASAAITQPKVGFAPQFHWMPLFRAQFPAEFGNSCCPFQGSGI